MEQQGEDRTGGTYSNTGVPTNRKNKDDRCSCSLSDDGHRQNESIVCSDDITQLAQPTTPQTSHVYDESSKKCENAVIEMAPETKSPTLSMVSPRRNEDLNKSFSARVKIARRKKIPQRKHYMTFVTVWLCVSTLLLFVASRSVVRQKLSLQKWEVRGSRSDRRFAHSAASDQKCKSKRGDPGCKKESCQKSVISAVVQGATFDLLGQVMAVFEDHQHRKTLTAKSVTSCSSNPTANEGLPHVKRVRDSLQEHLVKSSELVIDCRRMEISNLANDVEYCLTCIMDEVVNRQDKYMYHFEPGDVNESNTEQRHPEDINPIFPEADLAVTMPSLGHTPLGKGGNSQGIEQIYEDQLSSVVSAGLTYYKYPAVDGDIPEELDTKNANQYATMLREYADVDEDFPPFNTQGIRQTYECLLSIVVQTGLTYLKFPAVDEDISDEEDTGKTNIRQWKLADLRNPLSADITDLLSSVCDNFAGDVFLPELTAISCHVDETNHCPSRGTTSGMPMPYIIEGK